MIGLKRGTVEVVEHDPSWGVSFEKERLLLSAILKEIALDIQHVGSTAVVGLAAKPIIDIALAIKEWDQISEVGKRLLNTSWIDRGWSIELSSDQKDGDYLFVKDAQPECRTHHLHVVEIDTKQWNNYILFRDLLVINSEVRHDYAKLKHDLAEKYSDDRKSYTSAKNQFITSAIRTAE